MSTWTVDELRVLARLSGLVLPTGLLEEPWEELDAPVRDAVAVRGLLARGLVGMPAREVRPDLPPPVELAPGARAELAPLRAPAVLAEVELDVDDEVLRHVVAAAADGAVLVLTEREQDIWTAAAAAAVAEPVTGLVAEHADGCAAPRGREAVLAPDQPLLVDGEPLLGSGGTLRVAYAKGGTATSVRWVAAGEAGLWLLSEVDGRVTASDIDLERLLDEVRGVLDAVPIGAV